MQGPPTTMGCLGGLAHGLKTICKVLINHGLFRRPCTRFNKNHVQGPPKLCTIKRWVVQKALHMVLKPCARPTIFLGIIQFFVFYYFVRQDHYNISPILFFLTHIFFLQIIKFLLFYCFVRQEDYISLILSCFSSRHLFWLIIKILFFYYFVTNKHYKISLILRCFFGRH